MVNRKLSRKRSRKRSRKHNQSGGGFFATLKTAIVPLFFLGEKKKYKRRTARKISKKKRKIKNITRKFRRLIRRK